MLNGFRKSGYETRFRQWGFEKYSKGTPADHFKIANYRVIKAKTCGINLQAYRRGKPVTLKVLRTRGYLTTLELKAFERGELLVILCCLRMLVLTTTLIQLPHLRPRQISALECPLLHQEVSTLPVLLRFNDPHLPVPIMEQHRSLQGLAPHLSLPVSRHSRRLYQI